MPKKDLHRGHDHHTGNYLGHFVKFLVTFIVIVSLSLFLFTFTAGA
jgi:hypothetical protein